MSLSSVAGRPARSSSQDASPALLAKRGAEAIGPAEDEVATKRLRSAEGSGVAGVEGWTDDERNGAADCMVAKALAASREAAAAAASLPDIWGAPLSGPSKVPDLACCLTERLRGASGVVREISSHLAQTLSVVRVLQGLQGSPARSARAVKMGLPKKKGLPGEAWPVLDTSWASCWANLATDGWTTEKVGEGQEFFCMPGILPDTPGAKAGQDFFDTRLALLRRLRQLGSLPPRMQAVAERALLVEEQKLAPPRALPRALPRSPAAPLHRPRVAGGCAKAEKEAKALLEARTARRKIQDKDVLRILSLWNFRRNTVRANVMPDGVTEVASEMLGLIRIRAYHKLCVAKKSRLYPHVTKLLCQYVKDEARPTGMPAGTQFPFTTVCINKDYAAKRHRDRNNVGLSIIRAVGDFTGGRLRYWPRDPKGCDVAHLDSKDSVVLNVQGRSQVMNSTLAHAVEPFRGTRYSLVYFSVSNYEKTARDVRTRLSESCGLDLVKLPAASKVWNGIKVQNT